MTGAAGFIGFHVALRLLRDGREVVGIDDFNPYYDPALKRARFARLLPLPGFSAHEADLSVAGTVRRIIAAHRIEEVVHLAAQPGVRHGFDHAQDYVGPNLAAFVDLLEACRHERVRHLAYASSSSVYGQGASLPFSEGGAVDQPVSLYAATKRANELMAHAYAHLFGLASTGIRFFTVYGPWGRPDMAVYRFTDAIAAGRPIEVADGGRVRRDFTYIDDVVEGVARILAKPPSPHDGAPPCRLFNLGGDRPHALNRVIALIEETLGRKAERRDIPLPPGDVRETRSDPTAFRHAFGALDATEIEDGIRRFAAWYLEYRGEDEAP